MVTLVLLKDVKGLGKKGDIVSVKPGYAHNFLIPQGLGIMAGKNELDAFEKRKQFLHKTIAEQDKIFSKINEIVQQAIKQRGLLIRRAANNKGVLYDKVDKKELEQELLMLIPELKFFKINAKLDEPLEKLGKHAIDLIVAMGDREKQITIIIDIVSTQKNAKLKYSEIKKQLKTQKTEELNDNGN